MASRFAEDSRVPTRALQAYLVLIGAAWNHQILTYGGLSQSQMKYGDGGIISPVLGCIMGWCYEQGLPPLTVLVVNAENGEPGGGLTTVADFPSAVQSVFRQNRFDLVPPTISELEEAGRRAKLNQLRSPG